MNKQLIYATAGLLHDIGKFWQRADDLWENSSNLDKARGIIQQICPSRPDDIPAYQHAIWTYAFLDKYQDKFVKCGLGDKSMMQEQLINLSSYHHNPSTSDQGIITLADICSSGLDRSKENSLERNSGWSWDKYKSVPFVSPFSVLKMNDRKALDLVYPAQKMSIGEAIFPTKVSEVDNKDYYPTLWKEFESEFKMLPDANVEAFIFSLYHLLKKYSSFIPASTIDYPESSLFEHLKTTGAFAQCFASYREEFPEVFGNANRIRNIKEGHFPVKLFCGDISGIQAFIYSITNKAAAKSLKGRSFYVQLLAESIAREVLKECGCTLVNLVYAAGGKFYLLLPNTSFVNKAIEDYRPKLESFLWNEFTGQLSVNMDGVNFSFELAGKRPGILIEDEAEPVDVGHLWRKLAGRTSSRKRRKFQDVFVESFDTLFEAGGAGGEVEVCAVSGAELNTGSTEKLRKNEIEQGGDIELTIAKYVRDQINLGRDLYAHKYLVSKIGDNGYRAGVFSYWDMMEKGDTANQQYIEHWIRTEHTDEVKFRPEHFTPHEDNGLGWRLYGGSSMAMHDGNPATFEDIAKDGEEEKGARLGVLRMDVDNLGELFIKGFPEHKRSFSALATLSSMLDLYFGGHLNFIRNKDKYKNKINIIYSGGDDVFAIGRWSELIDFAADVRTGFKRFAGDRDDITISGGLVTVGPRFPIVKAAELAGKAEDAAKRYKTIKGNENEKAFSKSPDKNAFSLFNIVLSWQYDWKFVVEFKNDLVQWIFYEEIISKGLLMKLFDFYAQYARGEPDWQWNSAYTIARLKSRDNSLRNGILDTIKILLYTGSYKNQFHHISFDAVIASARWAELEIKQLKK
ncbi:MAG TPA: type III-A CRISPR-associated protein Cas10/Csm1 [Niabella sp.]|nr:type III-A CRISPR-associated protein Cas10/Csm1 [Agriterribacter sp.]HUN01620.1 type III-A CRISPR-associated protein Cas10/Csm1 [Niabella sp.]